MRVCVLLQSLQFNWSVNRETVHKPRKISKTVMLNPNPLTAYCFYILLYLYSFTAQCIVSDPLITLYWCVCKIKWHTIKLTMFIWCNESRTFQNLLLQFGEIQIS